MKDLPITPQLLEFSKAFDHLMTVAGFTSIGRDELGLLWRPEDREAIMAAIKRDSNMVPGSDEIQ